MIISLSVAESCLQHYSAMLLKNYRNSCKRIKNLFLKFSKISTSKIVLFWILTLFLQFSLLVPSDLWPDPIYNIWSDPVLFSARWVSDQLYIKTNLVSGKLVIPLNLTSRDQLPCLQVMVIFPKFPPQPLLSPNDLSRLNLTLRFCYLQGARYKDQISNLR